MALIGDGEAVLAPEVCYDREADLLDTTERRRIAVPQRGQRVGERSLPAMREPLRQHGLQPVVVRPSGEHLLSDDAPFGKRTARAVRERIRCTRGGIEREVRVVLQDFLVAPARVDV